MIAMLNLPLSAVVWPSASKLVERDAALLGERAEVPLEQIAREPVDAGGHRCVRGEHAARPHRLDRLVEGEPVADPLTDPFEPEEAGVALVGVEHLRVDVEGPQRPHAADAEHDLLPETVLFVAAVEAVGDGHGLGRIAGDVRVEQVERDPPDVDAPHSTATSTPARSTCTSTPVGWMPSPSGSIRSLRSRCQLSPSSSWWKYPSA